jgi:hypothetical protein
MVGFCSFANAPKNGHEVDTAVTKWLITQDVAFCYKGSTSVVEGTMCESSEIKSGLFLLGMITWNPKIITGNLFSDGRTD